MNKYITKINLRELARETGESQTANVQSSIKDYIFQLAYDYVSGNTEALERVTAEDIDRVNTHLREEMRDILNQYGDINPPIHDPYDFAFLDEDLPF